MPRRPSRPRRETPRSPIPRASRASRPRAPRSRSGATGAAQFVRLGEGAGEASLAPPAARGASATEQAKAFFVQYGSIFGIQTSKPSSARGERADTLGFKHATFQQLHRGVPVFGAELKATSTRGPPGGGERHRRPRHRGRHHTAPLAGGGGPDRTRVSWRRARRRVRQGLSGQDQRLVVYREGLPRACAGQDHLAYEVEVGNGDGVREFVFVDAHTGKYVDQITGIPDALYRRAYDGANLPPCRPATRIPRSGSEGDAFPTGNVEADNMIQASKETYDMFRNAFGRDSFDGAGATMDAIFNRGYALPERVLERHLHLVLPRASPPTT